MFYYTAPAISQTKKASECIQMAWAARANNTIMYEHFCLTIVVGRYQLSNIKVVALNLTKTK